MEHHDRGVSQMQQSAARVLGSTPELAAKVRQRPGSTGKSRPSPQSKGSSADKEAVIVELKKQIEAEQEKARQYAHQYQYRVGAFVKRETQAKKAIESLEKQLKGCSDEEHQLRTREIHQRHDAVVTGLQNIHGSTAKLLRDQEKDLMRAFRAKLQDVSQELDNQRNKKGDSSAELQARYRLVVTQLHASQELAQIFDKKYQQLKKEHHELTEKLKNREDDRQKLLKDLVLAKKEVARLKQELEEGTKKQHMGRSEPAAKTPKKSAQKELATTAGDREEMRNAQFEREMRYRESLKQMKRQLEEEKKNVRTLKDSQAKFFSSRTEIEVFLRQCLEDVKIEIDRRQEEIDRVKLEGAADGSLQEQERVLDLLQSQRRVVELLYKKTFAEQPPEPSGLPVEDSAWLNEFVPGDSP